VGITQVLATYCHGLKFQQLPEEVIDRVKYFFLDFIGVACRGSQEDSLKSIFRFVREMGRGYQGGVIIGTKDRAFHLYSALANGTSAHAIEMDDVNNEASLHPGAVVFPAALAASEMVGAGLPPTATYIVLAVIIVDPLRKLGIDPWVAHFFCFLLAVWGELSPPTSLTAAVSARIAEASFMKTMFQALKLCLPITLMTFAIFTRFNLVVNPGWLMIRDMLLVAISCWGITYAIFGKIARTRSSNILLRAVLAAASFVMMFHPDTNVSLMMAVIVLPATFYGVIRHRRIAPPKEEIQPAE